MDVQVLLILFLLPRLPALPLPVDAEQALLLLEQQLPEALLTGMQLQPEEVLWVRERVLLLLLFPLQQPIM